MRPPHRLLDRTKVHRRAAEHRLAHLRSGIPSARPRPKASGRSCWPPPHGSPPCPAPASAWTTPPPTRRRRQALWATRSDYAVLPQQLNAALAGHRPKTLRTHLQRRAIDLTLIPNHGKPFRDPEEIERGQAKDGTSHSHADATASVVPHGQRSTVARTGVKKGAPLKDVVQRLLLWDRGLSSRRGCRS
jgi:hypothetical protein